MAEESPLNPRILAFHEAGHAVMAFVGGVSRFTRISIRRSGNSLGGTDYSPFTAASLNSLPGERRPSSFEEIREILIQRVIGGPMAQALLMNTESGYQSGTGDSDLDVIRSLLLEAQPKIDLQGVLSYVAHLEPSVRTALTRLWPLVEILAEELLEHEELSFHEVLELFRQATELLSSKDREWANSLFIGYEV